MDEVYRDDNVVLKRNGEDYKLETTSDRASIRKNKMTFNSLDFSVNWTYEASAYAASFLA